MKLERLAHGLVLGALFWLIAHSASAVNLGHVDTTIRCPPIASPSSSPTITLTLRNHEHTALGVRIMSSFTVNRDETLEGAAILGPAVAATSVVDALSTKSLSISALPAIPPSLANQVASYVIVSEWNGGTTVEAHECLVFIPEPSKNLQLLAGVVGLFMVSRRRSHATTLQETEP